MYMISNRHRDELISMLTAFYSEGRPAHEEGYKLYNLRRRARLLANALEKKKPMEEEK